jgi:cytochrome c-type biogenesis protein CcmH/NrfG
MRLRRAGSSLLERTLSVAALGTFVGWLVHTSVDWIHLLPGVTAVALCAAAVLLRSADPVAAFHPPSTPAGTTRSRITRIAVPALAVLALVVVGALLSRQVLTERIATRANDELAQHPAAALKDANRALKLDGSLVSVYYTKAAAIARSGNADAAEAALREALRREPDNFVTWALLGDLSVRRGNLAAAKLNYSEAHRRNPRDVGLAALARDPGRAVPSGG